MPQLQLGDGTPIIDVREWDGTKWISRIVKVQTENGWEDCYRPIMFSDDGATNSGAIRRSTTADINNGFRFITNITFTVEGI